MGSRSAPLALAVAVTFLLLVEPKAALPRGGGGRAARRRSAPPSRRGRPPKSGGTSGHKRQSVQVRLAVWSDTLRLVRDRPLGVGAGNFEQAFIPYALGGRTRPNESLVFRSPHNEFLRVLAEEGLVTSGLLAALLLGLARAPLRGARPSPRGALRRAVSWHPSASTSRSRPSSSSPFEMAFPSLTAAVALGLAGACLATPATAPQIGLGGRVVLLVAIAGFSWALLASFGRSSLGGGRNDVLAEERACRLDPQHVEACTNGAWLRIRSGENKAGHRAVGRGARARPSLLPGDRLLGEDSMARGDCETGCCYLGLYDALFDGKSTLHDRLVADCPTEARGRTMRRRGPTPSYLTFPLAAVDRPEAAAADGSATRFGVCADRHPGVPSSCQAHDTMKLQAAGVRIVLRPRRRDGPRPAPQPPARCRPSAAVPGRQLVERGRQRGAGRPAAAPASSTSSAATPGSTPTSAATPGRRPEIYGMVYIVVPGTQPLVPVTFVEYGDESDAGAPGRPPGYPIPTRRRTQPQVDRGRIARRRRPGRRPPHADRRPRQPHPLRALPPAGTPAQGAGRRARARSSRSTANGRRPESWTSADAAGLAILPGLVRYDEVFGPEPIRHAFRFTVRAPTATSSRPRTRAGRARRRAAHGRASAPQGGQGHLRLSRRTMRKIFQAMKTYGLIVADNGSRHVHHRRLRHALGQRRAEPRLRSLRAARLRGGPARLAAAGGAPRPRPGRFYTLPPAGCSTPRRRSGPYGGPALPPRRAGGRGHRPLRHPRKRQGPFAERDRRGRAGDRPPAGPMGNATFPLAATVNYSAGQTPGTTRSSCSPRRGRGRSRSRASPPAGAVHVVVDVNGYFE